MMEQVTQRAGTLETAVVLNFTQTGRAPAAGIAASANEEVAAHRPAGRVSSQLDRMCNLAILAIVALPFLLGIGALVRRLIGT